MNNDPRYITGNYLYYIEIDLLEEGIDPEDVKDYYIKWHTLYITHMNDSVTEHEFTEFNWEHMDTKRPGNVEVLSEKYEDAEFSNMSYKIEGQMNWTAQP